MKRSHKGAHPPSSPNNINTRRSRPRTELSTATTEERHSPTLRRTDLTVPPSSRTSTTREPISSSSSSSIPLSTRSPSKTSNDRWNDPTTMRGRRELDTQQSGSGRSNVETSKAADASRPQPKGQRVNGEDGHPLIAVVSNLAWHVTMDDLWLLFGDIGEVQEIVMKKGTDGRFSGIAEVQYVNADDADRCLEAYSDVTFDNRAMRIRLINPLQPPPPHHPKDRREERRDEMVGQKFQDVRRRRPVKPFGESMGQRGDSTNRDGKLDSIKDFSPAKAHSHSEDNNMQQPRNLSQNHPPCRQQPREQDRYQQQPRAPADGLPPQRRSAPSTFPNRRVSEREQYDEERRRQRNLRDRAGMRWDNNPPHPPPDSWNRRSGHGSDPQWSRNNGPNPTNPQNHHQHQHRQHRHSLDKERRFLDSKINGAGQTCPTFDPDQNASRTNLHPPSSQRRSRSPPPPLHSDRQTGPGPVNDQPGGNSLDFRRNGNAGRGPNKRFYQSHRDRDLGRNRPRPY